MCKRNDCGKVTGEACVVWDSTYYRIEDDTVEIMAILGQQDLDDCLVLLTPKVFPDIP
jgi:hypothetical protein